MLLFTTLLTQFFASVPVRAGEVLLFTATIVTPSGQFAAPSATVDLFFLREGTGGLLTGEFEQEIVSVGSMSVKEFQVPFTSLLLLESSVKIDLRILPAQCTAKEGNNEEGSSPKKDPANN